MRLQTRKIEVEVEVRGVKITGHPLTPAEISKIHEKNIKIVGRGSEARRTTDTIAIGTETFSAMVTDWNGAEDIDGKPLKCTAKNKELVFMYDQDFVAEVTTSITEAVQKYKDGLEKN